MEKGVENPVLKQAWLAGLSARVAEILKGCNVLEHTYLLSCVDEDDGVYWRFHRLPLLAEVYLDECIAQDIDLLELQKVALVCERIGEYSGNRGNFLYSKAAKIRWEARKQEQSNTRNCRASMTALLGCCGKQRKVRGGNLRDVSKMIAKQAWKKRRDSVWKIKI